MTITTDDPGTASRVEAVLGLAALGWHVFPLRPDDKRPAVTDWENRATTDPDRITRAWSAGPYGVGVACGPSRLLVVDLDTAKGEVPPERWTRPGVVDGDDVLCVLYEQHGQVAPFGDVPWCRTGSGGSHLYFRAPSDRSIRNSVGKLGWKIDVRAAGGYVVAPPSTAAGTAYLWNVPPTGDVPNPPEWLLDLASTPGTTGPSRTPTRTAAGYAVAALRGEMQRVLAAANGERNDTLHRAAFNLGTLIGAAQLDPAQAVESLVHAAAAIGLGAVEAEKTITSGMRAGMGHPRAVVAA